MKRIIEIPDKVVEAIQNGEDYRYDIHTAIAQGTPYNPSGDAISREALKGLISDKSIPIKFEEEKRGDWRCSLGMPLRDIYKTIDNAPTVPQVTVFTETADEKAVADLKAELQNVLVSGRPQGKWVKIFENPFTNGYVCPFCGHKIQVTEQFLPEVTECESCGAEMKGGAE